MVLAEMLLWVEVLLLAKVLTALNVLTMGGWGVGYGGKRFKYTDKNFGIC